MTEWDRNCTMRYLNEYPLPKDTFLWPHRDGGERPVWPVHSVITDYGKWLRETPYFPGLFELIHDMVSNIIALTPDQLGNGAWLAEELAALRQKHADIEEKPGQSIAHQLRKRLPVPGQASLF